MYTEQNIRGLAINFLRRHYKLRPRSGTSGTRVVSRPHYYQGVTIDARLAYQQPDLHWFTATIEATSVDRAQEVLYRVNYYRIGVHALLGALLLLSIFLAGAQVQGQSVWQWFGRPDVYVVLFSVLLLSFLAFGYLLSRLKYYRYIYAIAQFMRFHADAQWVAYDRTIFFSSLQEKNQSRAARRHYKRMRKYYEELQRQCIRFGFGLLEVREDNDVRWLIEPSHIDQFGGRRSRLPLWIAAIQTPPAVKGLTKGLPFKKTSTAPAAAPEPAPPVPTDGMTDPLAVGSYLPASVRQQDYAATLVPAKKGRTSWYLQPARLGKRLRWKLRHAVRALYPPEIRKRPGYYELPWWVVTLLFSLLLAVGWQMYQQSHWQPLAQRGSKEAGIPFNQIEPLRDPRQSAATPNPLPGEYDHTRSANDLPEERDISVRDTIPVIAPGVSPDNRPIELHRIARDGEATTSENCLDLYRIRGTWYVLLEGRYPRYDLALERAEYLNGRYGMSATVALNNCLEPGLPGYALFLGDVVVEEGTANLLARELRRDYRVSVEVLVVR